MFRCARHDSETAPEECELVTSTHIALLSCLLPGLPTPTLNPDTVLTHRRQALEELIKHQQGAPFTAPVDPARDRCPDYLMVIKTPMDLG